MEVTDGHQKVFHKSKVTSKQTYQVIVMLKLAYVLSPYFQNAT